MATVDHHVHIFSDESRALLEAEIGRSLPSLGPDELLAVMDSDVVERAAVLSTAYFFTRPDGKVPPDAEAVSRENDWVGEQVAQHPDRLVGFFSVNPIHPSATAEIARCGNRDSFIGLKLHLANSDVDLRNNAHVDALAKTFAEANRLGLVVVVHLRTRRPDYGREDVESFIERVLPESAHVPVQIAHLGGWGGYDDQTDAAFGAFAEYASRSSNGKPNLYFDVSAVVIERRLKLVPGSPGTNRYGAAADKLRAVGIDRVLFGTDWPEWTPRTYVTDVRTHMPIHAEELQQLIANHAPWIARS